MTEQPQVSTEAVEPIGRVGPVSDRDPETGRFLVGNRSALVVGQHSVRFWAGVEGVQAERRRALLADLGHGNGVAAPEALLRAVDGLTQAVLLRDSAFAHVAESGGPTTLRGRRRAAFRVWCEASDRAHRYLQLLGVERKARPIDPLEAVQRAVAEANRP